MIQTLTLHESGQCGEGCSGDAKDVAKFFNSLKNNIQSASTISLLKSRLKTFPLR